MSRIKAYGPEYNEKRGLWIGGDSRMLYAFTDRRTGHVIVRPGRDFRGIGPEADVRTATRDEAERLWQSPLHPGWRVA